MVWILENPVPIWATGAVLGTLAGLVFLTRRTLVPLLVLAGIVGFTLLLALLEQLVVTQREEVERATYQLAAAIEANDLEAVLAFLAPTAKKVRSDAQALLARLQVAKAHVGGTLHVDIDSNGSGSNGSGPEAISRFRALVDAVDRRGGMKIVYYDEVQLHWASQDGRWRVTSYTAKNGGRWAGDRGQ